MTQIGQLRRGNLRASILGWLWSCLWHRFRAHVRQNPRLVVLERVSLVPRQSLVLVEALGRKFLVAASSEGPAAFYALEQSNGDRASERPSARVIEDRVFVC